MNAQPSLPLSGVDRLTDIFAMQRHLIEQTDIIVARNGFDVGQVPVEIQTPKGQARLKDFSWCTTEEIVEACDELRNTGNGSPEFREEVSDILHFLVEVCILAGMDSFDVSNIYDGEGDGLERIYAAVFSTDPAQGYDPSFFTSTGQGRLTKDFLDLLAFDVVKKIGRACNLLKNRPWKQTLTHCNVHDYHDALRSAFESYIRFAGAAGIGPNVLYEEYMSKHRKNEERRATGY